MALGLPCRAGSMTTGLLSDKNKYTGAFGRGRKVKNVHAAHGHGDAYWQSTREQLKAAQKRADLLSLLGVAAIGVLLWLYNEPGDGLSSTAMAGMALALIVICVPVWIVARRKREISLSLTCENCGYVPHDTEISEVTDTHQCPRCAKTLE